MSTELYTIDIDRLIDRLKWQRPFKIKLPHTGKIYVPEYRPQSSFTKGDIVVFSFSQSLQSTLPFVMVGTIQLKRTQLGVIWFDVDVMRRSVKKNNTSSGWAHNVAKVSIIRRDIICELFVEKK